MLVIANTGVQVVVRLLSVCVVERQHADWGCLVVDSLSHSSVGA